MPTFDYHFTVDAPLAAVHAFHGRTDVLKRLTPPPLFVQIHRFGAMEDGMLAEFTMWFGPVPVRWHARHVDVDATGFTDVQERGPLASWRHSHRFEALGPNQTRVHEHVTYTHPTGWRGVLTRLFFGRPGLQGLFFYRKLVTRWSLRGAARA